ncbi:MAG: hypothetical protein KJO21_05005 [Verrucomicrobiae bacterium]|nr:hypothetical protein [Verrucomicrobiae bacterium]NNJ43082.1 hypothetical protein [Akkermansiaceae bacterium]
MLHPHPCEDHLIAAIRDRLDGGESFNTLAMRVFRHQFQQNRPYQNYCKALRKSPDKINHWHEVPAVSTDVFKLHDIPVRSFPAEMTRHTFTTSGTTNEVKGEHHFPSLALYEQSITSAWDQLELPRPQHAVILTANPRHAPQSSLSHMMGTLSQTFASSSTWAMDTDGQLDLAAIHHAVEIATASGEPVALLGTAISFLHLFEQLERPLTLPTGSWAMETGGYKGTRRQMQKTELYALFKEKLGLPSNAVINEYSMTELSSQFYTRGIGHSHVGPSWTRTRVINPITDADALPGEPGHLVIYDLANLHSVMAIRTQDIAIAGSPEDAPSTGFTGSREGGETFTLIGRDPSALPRGCSRAADDTLQS